MSSDSSDDDEQNLQMLKEATASQFIKDSMYKKTDIGGNEQKFATEKAPLASLRHSVDEEEQFNLFRVTPEFRNYVAKHLSTYLEKTLETKIRHNKDSAEHLIKKKWKPGIKLFKNSTSYIKVSTAVTNDISKVINHQQVNRYKKLESDIPEDTREQLLREIAVSPEDILNKKEVKNWSKRSKAPIFKYKKEKFGSLVYIEPEFR